MAYECFLSSIKLNVQKKKNKQNMMKCKIIGCPKFVDNFFGILLLDFSGQYLQKYVPSRGTWSV